MDTVNLLKSVKQQIQDPNKWTKGSEARDENGAPISYRWGTCWCVLGAIDFVTKGETDTMTAEAEAILCGVLPEGFSAIYRFNDDPNTTHQDVMALFDRAIEKAQQQQ